jgi:Tfp pilus assembly protein PilN
MGRIRRRRLLHVSAAALVCLLAAGLSLWSLDRSRDLRLAAIRAELAVMTPRAQKAMELRDYIAAIDRESTSLQELARRRSNPLRVLVALSQRMPEGATVLNIKANHDNWQIDGTARDAAAIVPLLDKDNRFEDVRFLSASSRFQEGDRTYETFSIAFRVRPGD